MGTVNNRPVATLEKLIRGYERSLMDLMAVREELQDLPAPVDTRELVRLNAELALLTKQALDIARRRLEQMAVHDRVNPVGAVVPFPPVQAPA